MRDQENGPGRGTTGPDTAGIRTKRSGQDLTTRPPGTVPLRSVRISPDQCGRFEGCSASICPLDPGWRLRSHRAEDRVCLWLREHAKYLSGNSPESDLKASLEGELVKAIVGAAPDILSTYAVIKGVCEKAALTPSTRISPRERHQASCRGVA